MSTPPTLTTTSFSLLGLLAIQPWTAYELAKQMDRSLGRFWPRARSKIYEEPRKLEVLGLARSRQEARGRRGRTVYSITAKGRRELARWLAESSDPPSLESEHLLRVFFSDQGTTTDLQVTLESLNAWATEQRSISIDVAKVYASGGGQFPERLPVHALTGRFLTDYYQLLATWSRWALTETASWPEHPRDARADMRSVEQVAKRRKHRL